MIILRNTRQRRAGFPLPACRKDQDLAAGQRHRGVEIDRLREIGEIAILLRHIDNAIERATGHAQLPPGFARHLAQRMQARDIAGEGRHQHPLAGVPLDLLQQPLEHRAFRPAGRRIENVGAVADQRKDTLVADFGKLFFGRRFADNRVFVELPVAGVEDLAMRRVDQQGVPLGDRMRERDIGNLERTHPEATVVFLDNVQLDRAFEVGLFQLAPDQFRRERRRVDGDAEIGREIRDRPDVVFMRVSQDDGLEVLRALFDEFEIGENEIHARILPTRKAHAEIDHQPAALAAVEIDVHPDLAGPAEGQEQQFVFGFEIFLHEDARSASIARPSRVRSLSTASNRSVISSNNSASPPVATTLAGRPISFFIRATSPSISAT